MLVVIGVVCLCMCELSRCCCYVFLYVCSRFRFMLWHVRTCLCCAVACIGCGHVSISALPRYCDVCLCMSIAFSLCCSCAFTCVRLFSVCVVTGFVLCMYVSTFSILRYAFPYCQRVPFAVVMRVSACT